MRRLNVTFQRNYDFSNKSVFNEFLFKIFIYDGKFLVVLFKI